jgi:hypothetical protein
MTNNIEERRRFLKVVGATGLTAASLSFARLAMAQSSTPRRVIFVYTPDGCNPADWHPAGTGTSFTLPGMTAPLQAVREHCVFLKGVNMVGPGGTHQGGVAKLFTGTGGNRPTGVSLNYYLGRAFKSQTVCPHLNLNIVPPAWTDTVTFNANGVEDYPEPNPLAAFNSLFGSGGNSGTSTQDTRGLGVLDHTRTELAALREQLGADERIKLDAHLESLSVLENKLVSSSGACGPWNFNPTGFKVTRTGFWENPEYRDVAQMGRIADLHADVAVHALACDLTRVVTLQWSHSNNAGFMPEAGVPNKTGHDASHEHGADFIKIKAWYMTYLAKLINQLKATPDGNGTLLDNTLIFHGSCLGSGSMHDHDNMPFIIAGGKAGGITGGRALQFDNVPHNKILVSIAQFMGQGINTFGDQDPSGGPLPGLVG